MVFLRKAILSSVSLIIALFLFSCSYAQIISQIREDNKADIKEIAGDDEGFPGSGTDEVSADNYKSIYTIEPDDKFIYVLQNIGFKKLDSEAFDIAVIDPDDSGLDAEEISALKDQNKLLIAYLSIGEAEDYRSYWESEWKEGNPDFISEENPCWPGNYKVKYWDRRWKKIIFERLEKIIKVGYQGTYLDLVDAYEYFEDKGYDPASREMIDLVIEISNFTKNIDPGFLIIPQNGEELTADRAYLSAIDGAGKENLWFIGAKKIDENTYFPGLGYLIRIKNSGRSVFVIEYIDLETDIFQLAQLAEKYGFIYYAGGINLDCISD